MLRVFLAIQSRDTGPLCLSTLLRTKIRRKNSETLSGRLCSIVDCRMLKRISLRFTPKPTHSVTRSTMSPGIHDGRYILAKNASGKYKWGASFTPPGAPDYTVYGAWADEMRFVLHHSWGLLKNECRLLVLLLLREKREMQSSVCFENTHYSQRRLSEGIQTRTRKQINLFRTPVQIIHPWYSRK